MDGKHKTDWEHFEEKLQYMDETYVRKVNKLILKNHNGNYTIEAAIIIPITLFLILAMISLSFSLYNRCSMERAAAVSALRGSEEIFSDNAARYNKISQTIDEVLCFNLLSESEMNKNIKIKGNSMVVILEAKEKNNTFTTYSGKKAINPVLWIRTFRKMKGMVQKNDAGGI